MSNVQMMRELFMRLATEWDGFTVSPLEFHDAGPAVVVEARYTAQLHDAEGAR